MSGIFLNQVRKSFYLDSVALMRMSRDLMALDGIEEAAMMMGTIANQQIMADAGLLDGSEMTAGGGDLIIGIRGKNAEFVDEALAWANRQLEAPAGVGVASQTWRPRTLRAAVKSSPEANFVLISVSGDFAVAEARKAIRRGLHAMIFSDNVAIEEEVELKREARELGRLVMGPDCGTAIINGVPIAFANVVRRGSVGLIGASGTGLQEVSSLIAQYGGGVSHAIGVGGRDLNVEVGGISTFMGIKALYQDPVTKHIVLISKPPPAQIAAKVIDCLGSTMKPATVCFIGSDKLAVPENVIQVSSLRAAARAALDLEFENAAPPDYHLEMPKGRSLVQGLYSGGTLCAEAQSIFIESDIKVSSNIPISGVPHISKGNAGHSLIDMGDDQFTQGRPHPMIDPSVRGEAIISALRNPETGLILVDVVIGYGAHTDPAGYLARVTRENAPADGPVLIASVTGTEGDPQRRSSQVEKLRNAGIHVAPSNADAAELAVKAISSHG